MRRRKPQGPFAAPKSRPKSRPAAQPRATSARPAPPQSAPARATAVPQPPPDDDPSLYDEYPLITTKKALLDGLRHHVMRFTSDKEVNPYSQAENQFQRPIRLQRRFPHDTPNNNVVIPSNPEDDKEREKEAIRKAERQAERDANALLVAPTDKTASKKRKPFKKKVEDVYAPKDTEDAKKRAQLRYDESRPWHLEDFTGKNSWVGKYEAPLSETHAMFVLEDSGAFRMVPLEKWYRFTPTARFATLSLEEAEAHMNKKMKADRWFGHDQDKDAERKRAGLEQQQRMNRGRVGMRGENRAIKGEDDDDYHPELADDADEIDYELNEEFQDDDEDRLFGGDDDEAKESERRIKQERYNANIFAGTGVKEDKDWFDEEEKEKKAAEDERKKAKKLRKALIKKEKNFQYESDSDHPYSSEVNMLELCYWPTISLTHHHRATRKIRTRNASVRKKNAPRKKSARPMPTSFPLVPRPRATTRLLGEPKSTPTPCATSCLRPPTSSGQVHQTSRKQVAASRHTSASRRSTAQAPTDVYRKVPPLLFHYHVCTPFLPFSLFHLPSSIFHFPSSLFHLSSPPSPLLRPRHAPSPFRTTRH